MRRILIRRIRTAVKSYMKPMESGGDGFLFTSQPSPDHPLPEGRAARSIRRRALPGADDTFCGFVPEGIVVDYVAGNIAVAAWRNLRTGQLRGLLRVAESEARAEPLRRQRATTHEARAVAKVAGPAAGRRRETLLASARSAGPDGVYLRNALAHRTGMQLVSAGFGQVRTRDGEETPRFVAAAEGSK